MQSGHLEVTTMKTTTLSLALLLVSGMAHADAYKICVSFVKEHRTSSRGAEAIDLIPAINVSAAVHHQLDRSQPLTPDAANASKDGFAIALQVTSDESGRQCVELPKEQLTAFGDDLDFVSGRWAAFLDGRRYDAVATKSDSSINVAFDLRYGVEIEKTSTRPSKDSERSDN